MKYQSQLSKLQKRSLTPITLALTAAFFSSPTLAVEDEQKQNKAEVISITGSRIQRTELVSSSPVNTVDKVQIELDQAVSVNDIITKLPQAAGGGNSTGATSPDASTIDLRGLGQNRTLVLINGTRAVPFGFRNAVDVNNIPAGLIKRVDVLTGGAAAVYGADAVSGVVNFVMNDDFDGVQFSSSYKTPQGGGETFNVDGIFGGDIVDGAGHLTGYIGFSDTQGLNAGERDWAMDNSKSIINTGGFYTDIASGNSFGISDSGDVTADRQTTDATANSYLTRAMQRFSSGVFWDVDLADNAIFYGRGMFTQVQVTGAGAAGQTPATVNEVVTLTANNAYIPSAALTQLTFDANGNAQVNVERNLGLGLMETQTERNTFQFQVGLKGDLTDYMRYDIYAQQGQSDEKSHIHNNGFKTNGAGNSTFAAIANTVNLFDPSMALMSLENTTLFQDSKRTQSVIAATLSGQSTPLFELPSGPVDYAIGYEYRREAATQNPGAAVTLGNSYASGGVDRIDASFYSKEAYAEVLVPLLSDLPYINELAFEGAYRVSQYSNTDADDTYKVGLNWKVNDDLRVRWTKQSAFRAPNIGEFAGSSSSLSLASFDQNSPLFQTRFAGRFNGDPCLLGTGNAEQCARQGAAAPGTAWDTATAEYSYGGNPDIKPEKANSVTVGLVYTPTYLDGFNATVDYYKIDITDAVGVIQPALALQNCYIDNPVAGNSLCGTIIRDENTGLISRVMVNDFNLASFEQEGFDINANYSFSLPELITGDFSLNYQANIVTTLDKQLNATVVAMDCKGTYGTACSGDGASALQADYKHRMTLNWLLEDISVQLGWRKIGDVDYASDRSMKIDAQDYIDIAASWHVNDEVKLTAGVDNVFDKDAPIPTAGANYFNTVSDYSVLGRVLGLSVRYTPNF